MKWKKKCFRNAHLWIKFPARIQILHIYSFRFKAFFFLNSSWWSFLGIQNILLIEKTILLKITSNFYINFRLHRVISSKRQGLNAPTNMYKQYNPYRGGTKKQINKLSEIAIQSKHNTCICEYGRMSAPQSKNTVCALQINCKLLPFPSEKSCR